MSAMSDYLENALLDHIFNNVSMTSPASVYISLHTSAGASESTAAWSATELTGAATNYARAAAGPSVWPAASGGTMATSSDITFAMAGSDWGTITHIAIWDASSAGNLLFYAALAASRVVNNGDVARFAAGNLTVTFQ